MFNVDTPMFRCPDGNVVQFWEKPVQDKHRSAAAGRPIFYKALMARIISPAMKTQAPDQRIYLKDDEGNIIKRSVRYTNADTGMVEHWDEFFREQLKAYEAGQSNVGQGTPLESYPKLDVAQIAMLKTLGIHFLEQLAAVPDGNLGQLGPGGRAMRDGVNAYLDAAKGNAPMEALNQKNADLENQLAAMREQMAALADKLGESSVEKPRRGRPPRNPETQAA